MDSPMPTSHYMSSEKTKHVIVTLLHFVKDVLCEDVNYE